MSVISLCGSDEYEEIPEVVAEVEDEKHRLRRALTLAETILDDKNNEITDLSSRLRESRKRVEYFEERVENDRRRRKEGCEELTHKLQKVRADVASEKTVAEELRKVAITCRGSPKRLSSGAHKRLQTNTNAIVSLKARGRAFHRNGDVRMQHTHPRFTFDTPPLCSLCNAGGVSEKRRRIRAGSLLDGSIHPSPTYLCILIIVTLL
ncbi:hypothetical protein Y032_0297g1732 [Ancylostoma ceylanicum]|uniref:Uncharacterized protein n=1 Tax=Ancylostoma ceylanicum TaxID=53326 RepID=A0A016S573_9BILA|nr:hypothetical protein Y032_0297g1732 [Ancylostoma ceylanicum]